MCQLTVPAVDVRCGVQQPMLERCSIKRMQEDVETSDIRVHPQRERRRVIVRNSDILIDSSGREYWRRSGDASPTTGTSSSFARIALNFAIPQVQGFRWYPAMQSIMEMIGS